MFRVYTTDWPCRSVAHPLESLHTPRWGESSQALGQSSLYPLLTAPISDPSGLSALLTTCEAPSSVLLTCFRPHGARLRQRSRTTNEFKHFEAAAVVQVSSLLVSGLHPGQLPTTTRPTLANLDVADLRRWATSETRHVSIPFIHCEDRCAACQAMRPRPPASKRADELCSLHFAAMCRIPRSP